MIEERIKEVLCVVYCVMFVKLRWSSVISVCSVRTLTLSSAVRNVSTKCFYVGSPAFCSDSVFVVSLGFSETALACYLCGIRHGLCDGDRVTGCSVTAW